jgi:hypothetical protein
LDCGQINNKTYSTKTFRSQNMSNEGRFFERNPTVQNAGKVTAIRDESTANCMNPKLTNRVLLNSHPQPIFRHILALFS